MPSGIPVWSAGQVLTASDVDTWFVPVVSYKTSDTSRSSTTTVSNDPDLAVAMAANAFYQFQAMLDFEGSSTASQGIKWSWNLPASATMRYYASFTNAAGNQDTGHTFTGASVNNAATSGAGNLNGIGMQGTVFTSAASGNLTLQWAQNVSEASAVTLHAQSYVMLRRVG